MTERETESRQSPEMLGGVVILLGAIPAFAIAMALKKGIDATTPDVGGIAKLATALMGAAGKWPAFLACSGVAFLGAAIFVGVIERDRVRAIVGAVVASLGLAALMSALAPGAGGTLGEATGGRLASGLGAWAGVALGAVVIGGAAWLGWLQGRVELPATLELRWPTFRLPALPRRAEAVRAKQRTGEAVEPARIAAALTHVDPDHDGVSSAEANALAPDEKTLRYMEEVWIRAAQGHAQVAPMPPSPYPVDVRLRGEIPAGAQPLGDRPVASRASGAAAPVKGSPPRGKSEAHPLEDGSPFAWRPEPRPMAKSFDSRDEDSDPFVLGGGSVDDEDKRALADAIRREGAIVAAPSPYPPGVRPLGSPRGAPEAPVAPVARQWPSGVEEIEAYAPNALPPRPTWEQDELAELDDDGHVQSELPLRAERSDWAPTGAAVAVEEEEVEELEDGDELEAEDELDAEAEEDEDVEAEAEAEDEDEEDDEPDDTVTAAGGVEDDDWIDDEEKDDEDDDEEEADEDEEDEDEDEGEPEVDAELSAADEPTAAPAQEATPVLAAAATGDAAAFADDGLQYVEVEEPAPAPAPPARPAPAPAPARARGRAARRSPAAELDFGPAPERQVTLQPTAPRPGRAATLQRAGALFVHEGRVAVSLLQRQLGLEFDDACAVLDELQEAGLIGPYKGGQKRDILLTAEEWAERCAAS